MTCEDWQNLAVNNTTGITYDLASPDLHAYASPSNTVFCPDFKNGTGICLAGLILET